MAENGEGADAPQTGDRASVANREERQAFWTSILRDESRPMSERLRASELLARSEADFVTRVESKGMTLEQLIVAASSRRTS